MSEPTVPARAPEPPEQDPRAGWRSWTVPDAAVAGLVTAAAVAAAAAGGDDAADEDDEDGSWAGDVDRDEVLEELTEGVAAEGAVNTATQAAWDTFAEWS